MRTFRSHARANVSSNRLESYHWPQKDKPRPSTKFIGLWLLAPLFLVTMWAADFHANLATPTAQGQERVMHDSKWSDSAGGHAKKHEEQINPSQKSESAKRSKNAWRKVSPLVRLDAIERETGSQGAPIFVPQDVNKPTKVSMPPDGFPPPTLPSTHRNAKLLERIRKLSKMSPRWPKHPWMHAAELRSYGPAFSSIIVSHKLKAIYVPVFKVGTTSMMWNIAYLENNPFIMNQELSDKGSIDMNLHDMEGPAWVNHTIYQKSQEEIRKLFEDPQYLKFGFVRNPFERVMSAYLDKIVQWGPKSLEYQRQMYSLYGDDPEMRRLRNETKPTFREYLQAVEKVLKLPRTSSKDLGKQGSFETNKSRRDLHWRPQVELLHPDLVHLDFVGRFENLDRDREIVLNWMYRHTNRRMPARKEKLHTTNPKDKLKLYRDLRKDAGLRNLVLRIYKEDFERFRFSRSIPDIGLNQSVAHGR